MSVRVGLRSCLQQSAAASRVTTNPHSVLITSLPTTTIQTRRHQATASLHLNSSSNQQRTSFSLNMDPMFSEENRLASFKPAGSSRRRQTKAEPSMPQWPHPLTTRKDKSLAIPTPDSLAKYGFYFAPSDEHSDRTVHFLHDASVTGWKAGDNPLDRLEQQMPGNAWSMIWRSQQSGQEQQNQDGSKQWIWSSEELIPNGKQMCQARKETFATQWPYDGKKGWKPTSKKVSIRLKPPLDLNSLSSQTNHLQLADAGFHFTPTEDEPDSATCIYCNKGLGGWEKGDDPM